MSTRQIIPSIKRTTVVGILLLYVSSLGAQEIRADATVSRLRNTLLGTVAGPRISVQWLHPDQPFDVAVGAFAYRGTHNRVGVACGGFLNPVTDCHVEPIDERARVTGVSIALAFKALTRTSGWLHLVPILSPQLVSHDGHGRETGNHLHATGAMFALDLGAEGGYVPLRRWPLAIFVSARTGSVYPFSSQAASDAYEPFTTSFHSVSGSLGISYLGFTR